MARRRRRRSFPQLPRVRWPIRIILLGLVAAAGYFGKETWRELGLAGNRMPGNVVQSQPVGGDDSPRHPAAIGARQSGTVLVERVVDGDTLVIRGGDRVRLIGVDTPETHHPTKPAQPFGQEAFEFTRRMAEGKSVELQFDPGETVDRYGRKLAYVYVDGQFLNEVLIRQGLARALTNYPFSSEMKARFRAAESQAKAAKRGVWSLRQSPFEVGSKPSSKKAG
jgi:endonuclease YncB( thermonuclease family)